MTLKDLLGERLLDATSTGYDAARRVFPAIQGDPEAVWAWESAAGQAPAVRRGA